VPITHSGVEQTHGDQLQRPSPTQTILIIC